MDNFSLVQLPSSRPGVLGFEWKAKCETCAPYHRDSCHYRVFKDTLDDHNKTTKHMSSVILAQDKRVRELEVIQQKASLKAMREAGKLEEDAGKLKQLAVIFHTLRRGDSMYDYVEMESLLLHLDVPKLPRKHWSKNSGWGMAKVL